MPHWLLVHNAIKSLPSVVCAGSGLEVSSRKEGVGGVGVGVTGRPALARRRAPNPRVHSQKNILPVGKSLSAHGGNYDKVGNGLNRSRVCIRKSGKHGRFRAFLPLVRL